MNGFKNVIHLYFIYKYVIIAQETIYCIIKVNMFSYWHPNNIIFIFYKWLYLVIFSYITICVMWPMNLYKYSVINFEMTYVIDIIYIIQ